MPQNTTRTVMSISRLQHAADQGNISFGRQGNNYFMTVASLNRNFTGKTLADCYDQWINLIGVRSGATRSTTQSKAGSSSSRRRGRAAATTA